MRMRSALQRGTMAAVRGAAVINDRVRPPEPGVTALIYHRVGGGSPMSVDLPVGQFEEQIARIASRVVSIDEALRSLEGPAPAAGADLPVVVTFDDGTADVLDHALPVLVEHGVPMVLYLATRFVEEAVSFEFDGRPVSWQALADGLTTGCLEIGSHTHGHVLLDRIAPGAVAAELDRSIGLIEDHLGVRPRHFAYPKALLGHEEARRAVRERFVSAALAGSRANRYGGTDPWALARTPVQRSDDLGRFDAKVAGGLGLEDDLRRVLNRYRYRALEH